MADFENENPESTHDFINVDKPESEVAPPEPEPEHEPEVSSTTEIMEPSRTESDEHLQKEEKEETPEVSDEKREVSDEKPSPEADSTTSTSSSRGLTCLHMFECRNISAIFNNAEIFKHSTNKLFV